MLRITETEVFGFRAALRDMRNPKESWDQADSLFGKDETDDPVRNIEHIALLSKSTARSSSPPSANSTGWGRSTGMAARRTTISCAR